MNIQVKHILPQYFLGILLMPAKLFDDVSIFWLIIPGEYSCINFKPSLASLE